MEECREGWKNNTGATVKEEDGGAAVKEAGGGGGGGWGVGVIIRKGAKLWKFGNMALS